MDMLSELDIVGTTKALECNQLQQSGESMVSRECKLRLPPTAGQELYEGCAHLKSLHDPASQWKRKCAYQYASVHRRRSPLQEFRSGRLGSRGLPGHLHHHYRDPSATPMQRSRPWTDLDGKTADLQRHTPSSAFA